MEIISFEKIILDALLAGAIPELAALRAQAQAATVVRRETSGVGFFTTFAVAADAVPVPGIGRRVISDVGAEIEGVRHGAGFVLFIQNGRLDVLEAFTYDEPWPDEVTLRRWYYLRPAGSETSQLIETPERDVTRLASKLAG